MMVGSNKGLFVLKGNDDKWQLFNTQNSGLLDKHITSITEDRGKRIWIGTPGGLLVLKP